MKKCKQKVTSQQLSSWWTMAGNLQSVTNPFKKSYMPLIFRGICDVENMRKKGRSRSAYLSMKSDKHRHCPSIYSTVSIYSRLSLSRSARDSMEYFEISVPRHIRFAELRKTINRTTTFNKWICNLTPDVKRYIENIVEKRRNCS